MIITSLNYRFSYEITSAPSGSLPQVSLDNGDATAHLSTINGEADRGQADAFLGMVNWGVGNSSVVMSFAVQDDLAQTLTTTFFVLAGDPITDIDATLASITSLSAISSGPFAPGAQLAFSSAPGVVTTITDSINGGEIGDLVFGSADGDVINVFGGADDVLALGGDDTVQAGDGDDFVFGQDGNDLIDGGAGQDYLDGGRGDDRIEGGRGGDIIHGDGALNDDDGVDTILFTTAASGVALSLGNGTGTQGDAAGDSYFDIENVLGSRHADFIIGSDDENLLEGGRGADELRGGRGDDTLEGGGGRDILKGGAGTDTASFVTAAAGVAVNLTRGDGTAGNANGDTYISIENLLGSRFADILIGSAGNNMIEGGRGADELRGSAGNDVLEGGGGGDILNGGSGVDTASYTTATSGVALSLATGGTRGNANGDTFFRVENVIGSGFDDVIRGDGGANAINAGRGNDLVRGGSGDDTITGGRGNDTMYGGGGGDTFVFRANNGDDRLVAFNVDADSIRFAVAGLEFSDLQFSETAGNTVIDYGSGTITLDGISEETAVELMFEFG